MPCKVSWIGSSRYLNVSSCWSESIEIALTSNFTVSPRLSFVLVIFVFFFFFLFFFFVFVFVFFFFLLVLVTPYLHLHLHPFPFPTGRSLFFFIIFAVVCYSRLLNFFPTVLLARASLLLRSIIAWPNLIDDRFVSLRAAQSISTHTWVGSRVSRFVEVCSARLASYPSSPQETETPWLALSRSRNQTFPRR